MNTIGHMRTYLAMSQAKCEKGRVFAAQRGDRPYSNHEIVMIDLGARWSGAHLVAYP